MYGASIPLLRSPIPPRVKSASRNSPSRKLDLWGKSAILISNRLRKVFGPHTTPRKAAENFAIHEIMRTRNRPELLKREKTVDEKTQTIPPLPYQPVLRTERKRSVASNFRGEVLDGKISSPFKKPKRSKTPNLLVSGLNRVKNIIPAEKRTHTDPNTPTTNQLQNSQKSPDSLSNGTKTPIKGPPWVDCARREQNQFTVRILALTPKLEKIWTTAKMDIARRKSTSQRSAWFEGAALKGCERISKTACGRRKLIPDAALLSIPPLRQNESSPGPTNSMLKIAASQACIHVAKMNPRTVRLKPACHSSAKVVVVKLPGTNECGTTSDA